MKSPEIMRPLDLVEESESRFSRNKLGENEAMEICTRFRRYISFEFPNPRNENNYVLRPRGYVGHIPVSDSLLLRIQPKVPIDNLFVMLEYAYDLKSFQLLDGLIGIESLDELFERIASILSKKVLKRARCGLYCDYLQKRETLPFLRGRFDLMPSLRASIRGNPSLGCVYDEHTADLKDNQILAWTLYNIPRILPKKARVRKLVRKAYRSLSGLVSLKRINVRDCIGRFYHRLNEDYQPIHGLCRFFLDHCGPGVNAGEHQFIPFMVNMPNLFETFIARWLQENLPSNIVVKPQLTSQLNESGTISCIIDIVLIDVNSGKTLAVLDTKYKRKPNPENDDINQIVTYALNMNSQKAFLIYPSNDTAFDPINRLGDISVKCLNFNIGEGLESEGERFKKQLLSQIE